MKNLTNMDWLTTTKTILLHTKATLLHPYAFYLYYPLAFLLILLLSLTILLFSILIPQTLLRIHNTPKSIPWAGLRSCKIFPKLRACLRELYIGRAAVNEGYATYSKNNLPFIIPGLHWNAVVLPPKDSAWVAAQPENVLSFEKVLGEALVAEYLCHGPDRESVLDFSVLRRDLTRQMGKLTSEVMEEVEYAFEGELGMGEKEVSAMKLMEKVSFRAANRMFVGLPLCRSETYEKDAMRWMTVYGVCTLIMRYLIPASFKPIFGRLLGIPANTLKWWAVRSLRPQIAERLQHLRSKSKDGQLDAITDSTKPNDMLQWIISSNNAKPNAPELTPADIAGKMILLNIFAFSTTSTMACSVLFDILSYSEAPALLAELREEAERFLPLAEHDPLAIRSMTKLDSVIRETLRFNPLGAQGLIREVVSPAGVTTPDGLHLPRGTKVQSMVSCMQRDTDLFGPGVDEYQPLRFHEQASAESSGKEPERQQGAVQISEQFLSFGLGRHACPGRFFAVHTMKVMLGYLFLHYDVEPFKEKPKYTELGEGVIPNQKTKMKVRRRQKSTDVGEER